MRKNIFIFLSLIGMPYLSAIPVIDSVSPNNGSALTAVSITGSGFTGATQVLFGELPAPSFTVQNDNLITTNPPFFIYTIVGTVDVRVNASGLSAITPNDRFTYTGESWLEYVLGHTSPSSDLVVGSFPSIMPSILLSGTLGSYVALTSDGMVAVTTDFGTLTGDIKIFNLGSGATLATISGLTSPFGLAISPDNQFVYSVTYGSQVNKTSLTTFVNNSITIPGSLQLQDIVITPDGTRAYVSTSSTDILVLDITGATPLLLTSIPISGTNTWPLAISPNGDTVYVGNNGSSSVSLVDVATNTLLGTPVSTGSGGVSSIAVAPDGGTIYVLQYTGNSVVVIDVSNPLAPVVTNTVAIAPVGVNHLIDLAITPDGKSLYATDSDNAVVYGIDLTSPSFAPLPGSPFTAFTPTPWGIAVSPDPSPVASITLTPINNFTVMATSPSSLTPVGSIASYFWDFGDGFSTTTITPTATHTYTLSGTYTVSVTVTNSAGTSTQLVYTGHMAARNGTSLATASEQITISVSPLPPINAEGFQIANRFLLQTDYVNILTWNAPPSGTIPVAYSIYRNGKFIGSVPANAPLRFEDHQRSDDKTYIYTIFAVDSLGQFSSLPATVVIHGGDEE